ncbi:UDP-N-acetylmuramoyl-L-alanyl-D-glutamate--2,6-diaminopimelate ligase [Komagataeibacter intermedius]|uniref:UDP-N-acetylmuramoyl-L-alanyl-D-glutamate--2,6-diaminopimelate ligase n=2 Tax=Komagataeibacter intermedius TaxID=66229 RepID=A0A0N1F7P1_9PROT|nr:UDP-N-acetylmuramoyl-L-alanyl-D-glutamate--2,6-diaminopimelate ligase [Komagataeibacter intermedius]KPH85310.1 UDP-N-acetylmuramoyl-L-alanyl-D-glutamate--2,6-diaminopimelate ligase [Komagataeibacter intermedius AF2]MCF3637935.1 UDP-N-acetylmuramoyl-L-alanyl-D-glutamate--2,6-diaminopimelate ligase [Komagataeibacter intermedius]GAN86734.1 UDP-N-acetylmuramoylalanyl-D-glutamate--2,6-diaminopimelate ligase [Komagataeibacter intermedius TF2]GBQ66740.1 UDP-N-acetylmuramoylalanyl-D-glutamate--2, 6-
MRLPEVLRRAGVETPLSAVPDHLSITGITADSRAVRPGMIFAALHGTHMDGRSYIPQAVAGGAVAVLLDMSPHDVPAGIVAIRVPDARRTLAQVARVLTPHVPECIAAVTGTNGKTSTVEFLRQIWTLRGDAAGTIGTLGAVAPCVLPDCGPVLTTPDSVGLMRLLGAMAENGVGHVAIEASSHGLEQRRLDGLTPYAAGFSNLTRDHLDYHGTTEHYRAAKLRLFDTILPEGGIAAINADMDVATCAAITDIARRRDLVLRSTGEQGATLRLLEARPTPTGQVLRIATAAMEHEVTVPLVGRFQVDNMLLAAAMADRDVDGPDRSVPLLARLRGVRGRMEQVAVLSSGAAAYVDYAHTPDALERLLRSLRPHTRGRLVVVMGAGGDRDRGKRPVMGETATRLADRVIVTDDNPRTEQPAAIRAAIMAAAPGATEIGDRRQAIAAGLDMLDAGDVLVVAGKGHEQGQIVGRDVLPFDDATVIRGLMGNE